ncbi:hypothetical protein AB0K04_12820 [Micromonospora coxensis]|uniref:hypothetical protein n=1 Tax=Micromonospora coxensis TaxID=356852 RepID=UPI0034190855
MSLIDDDPVMAALRLVLVAVSVFAVVFGVRVAVSRQFPQAWVRVARLTRRQRSQPVRVGGGAAFIGASQLIQQVPFVVPMPYPAKVALFVVAFLLLGAALAWFALRRD